MAEQYLIGNMTMKTYMMPDWKRKFNNNENKAQSPNDFIFRKIQDNMCMYLSCRQITRGEGTPRSSQAHLISKAKPPPPPLLLLQFYQG